MYILSECKVRTGYCTPRCGPTRACFIFQPTGYKGLHSIRTAERKSKVKVIVVEKGGWKGRGNMCSSCIIHIPGFPQSDSQLRNWKVQSNTNSQVNLCPEGSHKQFKGQMIYLFERKSLGIDIWFDPKQNDEIVYNYSNRQTDSSLFNISPDSGHDQKIKSSGYNPAAHWRMAGTGVKADVALGTECI